MKEKFLISGYTKRASKGVYSVLLDTEKKSLSALTDVAEIAGPTYLTTDAQGHIYTVATDGNQGGTAAFTADGVLINKVLAAGASNCYVAVDEERQLVYGANYHMGQVRVYGKNTDGSLVLRSTTQHSAEHGPKPEQTGPLCHFAHLTPDSKLVVCDLGADSVYLYAVSTDGKLTELSVYHSAAGSGDRHLVFSPTGKVAYLACELDSTVEVLSYEGNEFSLLQKISTLPETHTGFNGVAAIRLSADGKFLYVSNRGHNSLVSYSVSADEKKLSLLEWISTYGLIPRDFNFSQDEKFVLAANQESDNLTLYSRNATTGKLTLLQKDFYAPEITCVYPLS